MVILAKALFSDYVTQILAQALHLLEDCRGS